MIIDKIQESCTRFILVKGNISVNNTTAADADANNTNKKVIFKNCAPFTDSITIINTQNK